MPALGVFPTCHEVPEPDELVFISWFKGGEVFCSGRAYRRGRIFYFRPGHETFPTYHDANVQRVIANATRWAAPATMAEPFVNLRVDPVERGRVCGAGYCALSRDANAAFF